MTNSDQLGPLALLVGTWYGKQGKDIFPLPKPPGGNVESEYTQQTSFIPIAPILNGPQLLYGVRYTTVLVGTQYISQQHQETGYYLYNPQDGTFLKSSSIPRGESILAKGLPNNSIAMRGISGLTDEVELLNVNFNAPYTVNNPQTDATESYGGILNTPFLTQYFDVMSYSYNLKVIGGNQTQNNVYGPGTSEVPRRVMLYSEEAGIAYAPDAEPVMHKDENILWLQNY